MMIVDKILDWARGRGYAAVYGSAGQVNEMLTDVDFAASEDSTAVIMHLVTDSATIDGKDTAVVAVYFASLCDFDFDGESLLPEQERLKGIGKELLNDIRTGNEMTYSDPRWQYGYDDYAEDVCWVCLRVTLTASAADCVPLSPEPPTPPPTPEYDLFCPQIVFSYDRFDSLGRESPIYHNNRYFACVAVRNRNYMRWQKNLVWIGNRFAGSPSILCTVTQTTIDSNFIANCKGAMHYVGRDMTPETESWLTDRIGRLFYYIYSNEDAGGEESMLAADSAYHFESKPVTVI